MCACVYVCATNTPLMCVRVRPSISRSSGDAAAADLSAEREADSEGDRVVQIELQWPRRVQVQGDAVVVPGDDAIGEAAQGVQLLGVDHQLDALRPLHEEDSKHVSLGLAGGRTGAHHAGTLTQPAYGRSGESGAVTTKTRSQAARMTSESP